MRTFSADAFTSAERYLMRNARVIDRHRFARIFHGGPTEPVLHALRTYQNPDGGFGNALEPDLRGSGSQPQQIEVAFWILDELDAFADPMVRNACDWLAENSTKDGGVPFVLASVTGDERAPWWQPQGEPGQPATASLNPTGPIVGLLHRHGIDHPWMRVATEFCWDQLAQTSVVGAYDAMCTLAFLEGAPDRNRAEAEFDRLTESLLSTVALDPAASGHVHSPLDFAPRPDSMARRLFADSDIDRHLDAVIDSQGEDGGWSPNFPAWTPLVAHEWGGYLTLARLKTLQAYGRIEA